MKKQILALSAAASLVLTGCASMLNRDYDQVTHHVDTTVTDGEDNILRAESYQELVNALIYLINKGADTGTIRFLGDEMDVKKLLDEACLEVVQEDPLGAYAVEFIKYSVSSIMGSNEADVQITYRRTREEISSIVDATGSAAIRSELSQALATFSTEVVLRIGYFEEDEAYIRQLMWEAYLSNPEAALGIPETQITMYPKGGQRRIVEVRLSYHQPRQTLESRRNSLLQKSSQLAAHLEGESPTLVVQSAVDVLHQAGSYTPGGGSTAYDMLLEGAADSQGVALAAALLCRQVQIPCIVVVGQKDGSSHFWNIVRTEAGHRHMDASQTDRASFHTDLEMSQLGYEWDRAVFPVCGEQED